MLRDCRLQIADCRMQIAAWSEQQKSRRRNKGHVSAAQNRWHAHGSRLIQSHAEAMRRQMGGVEERVLECLGRLGRLVAAWGKEAMGSVSWGPGVPRRVQLNGQGRTTCVVQGRGRHGRTTCTKPEARSGTVALDRGPMFCHAQAAFQRMLQTTSGREWVRGSGMEGQRADPCALCPAAEARRLGCGRMGERQGSLYPTCSTWAFVSRECVRR
jgi:hypothetical protein